MFRNNLIIAFRHMRRRIGFSVLNVLGMALGLASSVLLINFLVGQWSFDRFHTDSDRIYRLVSENKVGTEEAQYPNVPPRIGYDLQEMMPEVEISTRLYAPEDPLVRQGDLVFEQDRLYAADSNFFKVFDFSLLEGDREKVLYEANRVLITPELVTKYFPNRPAGSSVVGETLLLGVERVPFLIEGIVEAPPTNSQIQFEMLTSMASWGAPNYFMWSYVWANTLTYVRLIPQADYVTVNDKIPDMVKTYAGETTLRIWGISYEELEAKGDYINFYLQPMEEVYLHSADLGNRVGPVGNIQVYKGLVAVAIFILLIACINFMNLSTAQAGQRAKEVGIRKTLGSASSRLRSQFLLESMVYSGLAWLLSLGLYELLVVSLQRALPDTLVFGLGLGQRMVVTFLVAVFMALLAGLYPAFYLTAFRPIEALKGKLNRGLGAARLRNGLVVLQFSISMAMIISTLVVLRQWQYARRVDVGFQRDQVLLIENTDNLGDNLPAFMDAMRAQSGVISASGTTSIPGSWAWGDFWETPGSDKTTALDVIQTDPEFGNTLGLEMMEGRYLSEQFPSDSAAIVLNEAAVAEFGLEAPVLGKQVIYTSPFPGMPSHFTVVGVVKDFHMADFNQSISSVGILMQNGHNFPMNTNFIAVRYQAEQTAAVIASAQYLWKELQVETAFSYGFLDETFGQLFEAEETLTRVFAIFSGLTIFIACLGLFGLAAFTAERRTKEVGVRKVLGATEVQLLGMLNRHFTRLVVISFLIGAPVAAYLMNLWLAEFVYRIPLSPWIFLIGGLAGLLISWLTVSFQSWRVARLNPIQSLRDE